MTLRDLEYYTIIAAEGSITRAAARLYVAQPALSQCVRKLERELGVKLLVRGSGGVHLTSEGACFLAFAEQVLRQKDTLGRHLQDISDASRGEIRLGFTGTQSAYVLPHILPDFQKRHPHVTIVLTEGLSDEIEQKLVRREIDIGILHLPILCQGLDYFEISRDNMMVVPRQDSSYQRFLYTKDGRTYIHLEFLKNEPLILTRPGQRSRMVCDHILANAGVMPQILQTSRNISTLDALAQVNYASTILPEKQISPALKERGVYCIDESAAVPYSFVAASARNSYLPAAVQRLEEELRRKQYTF